MTRTENEVEERDQLTRIATHLCSAIRRCLVIFLLLLPAAQGLAGMWMGQPLAVLLWSAGVLAASCLISGGSLLRALRVSAAERGGAVMLQALGTFLLCAVSLIGARLLELNTVWVACWFVGGHLLTMGVLCAVFVSYTRRAPLLD